MSVLSDIQIYGLLQESWIRFIRRFDEMATSTNYNADFVDDASSLTCEMEEDLRVKMWHHHLKKAGMKLTYAIRDSGANRYIHDPSDPRISGRFVEINSEVALKIMALGHIP
jgi:hypothetical protein